MVAPVQLWPPDKEQDDVGTHAKHATFGAATCWVVKRVYEKDSLGAKLHGYGVPARFSGEWNP